MTPRRLVFTDLDGSLLDHDSYSFEPAAQLLAELRGMGVPVIPCTSKTRAELLPLRKALGNRHPFICENGAAVFVPRGYFTRQPPDTAALDSYWVREASAPRAHWLDLLQHLSREFEGEFESFDSVGVEGVAALTGLDPAAAALACARDYSEPVRWLGEPDRLEHFKTRLREAGATPLQGGRFLSVAGDCDKGRALQWLAREYATQWGVTVTTLGIGDSGNDVAMLEAADRALLIRSPVHDFPALQRTSGVTRSRAFGPAGWAEGVADWLRHTAPSTHNESRN